MKKFIKFFALVALVVCMASCASDTAGYNKETCQALKEKIDANQEMTEQDYDQMIDQVGDMVKVLQEKKEETGDDTEKIRNFAESQEGQDLVTYTIGFIFYLDAHQADLTEANKTRMKKLANEFKKLGD